MAEKINNYYAVPFDTDLGRQLTDYYKNASQCNRAATVWCKALHKHYKFPALDDSIEIIEPDDTEAGGVWAIAVPESLLTADNTPDPELWNYVKTDEAEPVRYYLPRITSERHYLRYKAAVDLLATGNTEWSIDTYQKDNTKPYMYYYDQVRRIMSKSDYDRLCKELGPKGPSAKTRIATGTRYVLSSLGDQSVKQVTDDKMRQAIELYNLMYKALPTIAANTLVRMTGFSIADIANMKRSEVNSKAHLDTRIDNDNRRYLFRTGMTSSHKDMEGVIGVERYFDK